ncbi:hypothetical protein BS47DRAFT_1294790 [Hydnum rufescens UP504]|uniref:Uncharacterized protein n=1 Tax=Hydnum rufescens UP504 TaxID=1448309 RepID=A0A9P6B0J3_9AGAM|nr:hypothetical protein BS47DRAFT_1294790 [Hydnum rufescens UP504]
MGGYNASCSCPPLPNKAFEYAPFSEQPAIISVDGLDEGDVGDDFGDFGDFGDANDITSGFEDSDIGGFDDIDFSQEFSRNSVLSDPGPSTWEPLQPETMQNPAELSHRIEEFLAPIYWHTDPATVMSREGIRQVEGMGQILQSPESRFLHDSLMNPSQPLPHPPNWTRSRIRRQHLISLGIPVNLDEVLPQSSLSKALPALQITSRPSSAPPGPRSINGKVTQSPSSSLSRAGSPQGIPVGGRTAVTNASSMLSIGPKPVLDRERIDAALALDPCASFLKPRGSIYLFIFLDLATLPLLPLSTLTAHLESLRSLTASTSGLLSHLLQTREALRQDSETYNGLIGGLVVEAQKMKSGPQKGKTTKRGSTYT